MWLGSITMATQLWMGFAYIYNTKKGQHHECCQNFSKLNKRLARKLCPIPKTAPFSKTRSQELGGITYAIALDLNMFYYTIRLDPDASKICTTILLWGKYSYLGLPLGVACFPVIFQAKESELIVTLEFVQRVAWMIILPCCEGSSSGCGIWAWKSMHTNLAFVSWKQITKVISL